MSSAVQESSINVGTATPVSLGSNGFLGRAGVTIYNAGGGGNLYVGGPNVTIGTGMAIASNATPLTISTPEGAAVYAIGNQGTSVAKIIEF